MMVFKLQAEAVDLEIFTDLTDYGPIAQKNNFSYTDGREPIQLFMLMVL